MLVSQLSPARPPSATNWAKFVGQSGTSFKHCTLRSLGQVMLGGWASMMVTVNVQMLVLLQSSLATHVTTLAPLVKVEPLGGLHATVGLVEQLSLAVAVQVTLLRVHWLGSVAST